MTKRERQIIKKVIDELCKDDGGNFHWCINELMKLCGEEYEVYKVMRKVKPASFLDIIRKVSF